VPVARRISEIQRCFGYLSIKLLSDRCLTLRSRRGLRPLGRSACRRRAPYLHGRHAMPDFWWKCEKCGMENPPYTEVCRQCLAIPSSAVSPVLLSVTPSSSCVRFASIVELLGVLGAVVLGLVGFYAAPNSTLKNTCYFAGGLCAGLSWAFGKFRDGRK
jgi:hypothetical protein